MDCHCQLHRYIKISAPVEEAFGRSPRIISTVTYSNMTTTEAGPLAPRVSSNSSRHKHEKSKFLVLFQDSIKGTKCSRNSGDLEYASLTEKLLSTETSYGMGQLGLGTGLSHVRPPLVLD
ncbi:hypothetical protein TNCV_1455261 [Trichonephila clavipes]|nr:hypothetical protein TNCV_1455261 [Trichonephila clavipes]